MQIHPEKSTLLPGLFLASPYRHSSLIWTPLFQTPSILGRQTNQVLVVPQLFQVVILPNDLMTCLMKGLR